MNNDNLYIDISNKHVKKVELNNTFGNIFSYNFKYRSKKYFNQKEREIQQIIEFLNNDNNNISDILKIIKLINTLNKQQKEKININGIFSENIAQYILNTKFN